MTILSDLKLSGTGTLYQRHIPKRDTILDVSVLNSLNIFTDP